MANHLNDTWFFDIGLDDNAPPFVTNRVPAPSTTLADLGSNIAFDILDLAAGVDLTSLVVVIDVNGSPTTAINAGAFQPGFSGTIVAIANGYTVTIDPDTDFAESQTITISIDAQDLALIPNVMTTVVYQLFTAFPIPTCQLAECRIVSLLGSIIQLDARTSFSPDGNPLTFNWKFIQVPSGSVFEPDLNVINPASVEDLRPSSYSAISFIPDKLGDYLVELFVSNGGSQSPACTALVSIGLSRALCGSGKVPDARFMWSFISNFYSLVDDRSFFETLWSGQMQMVGTEIVKLWSNDYNKSLDTVQQTVQRRWQQFVLHTELSENVQRVIVGNNKDGTTGITGEIGASGAGTTTLLHTLLQDEDFTTVDVNYGAKGRVIDVNGQYATIERVNNVEADPEAFAAVFKFDGVFTDITSEADDDATNVSLFDADTDYVYFGFGQKFGIIQAFLSVAGSDDINPVFEYSNGAGGWLSFTPSSDTTTGFTQNGEIRWDPNALSGWGAQTENGTNAFYVRVQRSLAALPTLPTELTLRLIRSYSLVVTDEEVLTDGQSGVPYRVPHMIHFPLLDLEEEGVRVGDVLVLEWTRRDTGLSAEMEVRVVAIDRERVGFEFTQATLTSGDPTIDFSLFEQLVQDLQVVPATATDTEIAAAANAIIAFIPTGINLSNRPFTSHQISVRAGRVVHNTAKRINDLYVSIPFLQEEIRDDPPLILRENLDYEIEDGYLVFASNLFSITDPAPEQLWAECTHVDNTPAIESNFGVLVDLSPDDLVEKATRAPYLAAIKGLWFALTNGPTVANLRLGLQVLMGLPFAEARGKILNITNNFSTDTFGRPIGRILVEDVDDDGRGLGIRRFYFFPEDAGVEISPLTGVEYVVGDIVEAFAVLSKGVEVTDYVKDPTWWFINLAGNEVKKFFLFRAEIDTTSGVFNEDDLVFSVDFIRRIKPVYTDVVANVLLPLEDDVLDAVSDSFSGIIRQFFYDNVGHFGGHESTFRSNDYNHQGITLWRGDSRPFSTRSTQVLRDVVTSQNGADVEATSTAGFGSARARITGDATTPTIEGDMLATWYGQPGGAALTNRFYEFLSLTGSNGPAVLNQAPSAEPTTMDLDKPDSSLFDYSLVTGQTGAAANVVIGAAAGLKRISGLTGMSSDSVGRVLTLSGSGDNDGAFKIGNFEDATTVDVIDASPGTIPDANNGSISWTESREMICSVVRRCANPKVIGSDLETISGAIQIAESLGSLFSDDGVGIDDHLVIESGANAGEYRIVSTVAQSSPRDYTPTGVPQITNTQVGLVNLDGSAPGLANLTTQDFRVISPVMALTTVPNAQVVESGGDMYAEILDPVTGFPFDVFTPGMVGGELVVVGAENVANNGVYTMLAYSHPGRMRITTGSPQTSDAAATATLTIRSAYHPGFERAEELAPLEVIGISLSAGAMVTFFGGGAWGGAPW